VKTLLLIALLLSAFVAGCSKPAQETVPDATTAAAFPWSPEDLARIDTLFGKALETASGLRYQPITPGTGDARPKQGETVTAHYRGTLLDGTVFDESYKRGEPIRFPVGVGRVIKGWDEALVDMTRGEKRRLIIPYWLAYGEAGRPPVIPPKATLVFEVELVGWESAPKS